jgi:hypothetical protein
MQQPIDHTFAANAANTSEYVLEHSALHMLPVHPKRLAATHTAKTVCFGRNGRCKSKFKTQKKENKIK